MTGYGQAVVTFGNKKIHAEIKSLNSKQLDLSTRIAPLYREKEMEIRTLIAQMLERGKVDFSLWTEEDATTSIRKINMDAALAYYEQVVELGKAIDAVNLQLHHPNDLLAIILRNPDVMETRQQEELTDNEWAAAQQAVQKSIDRLIEFRTQEGIALERKFDEKISNIEALLFSIEPFEKERVEKVKERIRESLEKNTGVDYDKNRFEQELIYYIEKLDINEEKQRLANHLNYFRETMRNGHGQGKKLGFIAQEMGREINTTGSKSNQAEMQNIVVKMKDELEQIKEQVLNVM